MDHRLCCGGTRTLRLVEWVSLNGKRVIARSPAMADDAAISQLGNVIRQD